MTLTGFHGLHVGHPRTLPPFSSGKGGIFTPQVSPLLATNYVHLLFLNCHPEDGGKIRAAFCDAALSVMVALRQSSLKEERPHFPSYRNRREERKCTNRFRDWRMSPESV
jgi:hypothetical protein